MSSDSKDDNLASSLAPDDRSTSESSYSSSMSSPALSPDLDYIRIMEGTPPPESSDDNQTDEEPSGDEEEDDDDEEEEWSNEEEDDNDNNDDDDGGNDEKPTVARSVLAKTMSRGHPTRTTRRRRTKLSRLYISLFILSISSQTVSNMYSTEIFYIIANRLVC